MLEAVGKIAAWPAVAAASVAAGWGGQSFLLEWTTLLLGGIHIAVRAVKLVDSTVYRYYSDHSVELPPVELAAAAYIEMVDYQPIN